MEWAWGGCGELNHNLEGGVPRPPRGNIEQGAEGTLNFHICIAACIFNKRGKEEGGEGRRGYF